MSDVEVQSEMDNDSFMRASGYRSGKDRRAGGRIPLSKPVRVGPPGGLPQSPVSAADLSAGGLFIDADRPVRIGARFSVQVPLAGGTSVYVEEAEVVYNRQTASKPGFGVRFLRMDPDCQAAIQQQVERLSPKTLPTSPGVASEDAPTVVPAAFGGNVTMHPTTYHDPSIIEDTVDFARRPTTSAIPWRVEAASWLGRHARRIVLALGAVGAVAVLTATVIFLWSTPRPMGMGDEALPMAAVPADTHRALMEAGTPAAEVVPPPPFQPSLEPKKRPLPGLVNVESPPAASVDDEVVAPPGGPDRFIFRVSPQARLRKTMIFRAPERFVIDIFDQDPGFTPRVRPTGGIRRFRVGRHPDFVRLVLDAEQPIKTATARIRGQKLQVSVDYR